MGFKVIPPKYPFPYFGEPTEIATGSQLSHLYFRKGRWATRTTVFLVQNDVREDEKLFPICFGENSWKRTKQKLLLGSRRRNAESANSVKCVLMCSSA